MKRLHLICNAHLDPIWQWTWDEGISAVIATFKSAADLAEEFDYVFCHGESLLYETIERNAPDLFARIRRLVKLGKWHVSGGWYLQPDCLMPCGETLVRQISVGKAYFREKFGVEPVVATNYDSFGHSIGLVQIMAKNGYKGYLTCRPRKDVQIAYPSRFFKWIGPDGSSVIVSNSSTYNSALGGAADKIRSEACGNAVGMLGSEAQADEKTGMEDVDYVLWGVGNHGGGPSRKDLRDIARLELDGIELMHSTPERLFADELRVGGEMNCSLVTCMPGCYSSMARIKQGYRRAENLFYATEKMLAAATLAGMKTDLREFAEAQKKLLLATFHDILPGTCIEEGEREGLGLLSACEKTMRDYRTQAFLYFVMGQPCAGEGEFPVFAFNYLPYEVEMPIEAEFTLADQNWDEKICYTPYVYDTDGKALCCQLVKEDSTLHLDWRKRIAFIGRLKPLGITRFTVKVRAEKAEEKKAETVDLAEVLQGNPYLRAPALLESYDDTADPWGMSLEELKSMGKNPTEFRLMTPQETSKFFAVEGELSPVRIVEDGDVVTVVEGAYTSNATNAVLQYKLYKNQPYTDIKATVEFADKNKLIRIKIPVPEPFARGKAVGDGPYVWEEKPDVETSFQKWLGVQAENGEIFAVANDGVYAGKVENGYIYLTLLRGAGYCVHPIGDRTLYPQDRYLSRIDCGRYVYSFRLIRGNVFQVCEQAERLNQPPYAINVFPTGENAVSAPSICVDGEVLLSAIKQVENGYVLRIYNPKREAVPFTVTFGESQTQATAFAREIVSLVYQKGEWTVCHDVMP